MTKKHTRKVKFSFSVENAININGYITENF